MEQNSLFQNDVQKDPLAARLRPASLQDYVGQKHLLGKGKILYNLIEKDMVSSMIFWGPPGVGKTTLARIIARQTQAHFINFSAVTSGIREIKTVMKEAEDARLYGRKTIVFVDEIHRFNKAQQDAFLPYVEKGSIILIGATTENPSFEVNAALLSRCKVFVLKALEVSDLVDDIFRRTLCNTDNMLCCPAHFTFLLCEFFSRSLTDRTKLRSCIPFVNITANTAYKFSHNQISSF